MATIDPASAARQTHGVVCKTSQNKTSNGRWKRYVVSVNEAIDLIGRANGSKIRPNRNACAVA